MSERVFITSRYQRDKRLKPCPICGAAMMGRWKNHYGTKGWNFSCSNKRCLLHCEVNVIRVPRYWEGNLIDEDEAIAIVNGDARLPESSMGGWPDAGMSRALH